MNWKRLLCVMAGGHYPTTIRAHIDRSTCFQRCKRCGWGWWTPMAEMKKARR